MAEPIGVEPIPARSKQAVLPLHHGPKLKLFKESVYLK